MAAVAGGSRKRAYSVAWRNFQSKKNKTWESDGFMLVEGTGVTVYSVDGKYLGARNLNRGVAEGDVFTINNKDVQVTDECSLDEYYQVAGRKSGQADAGSSTWTPAEAVPGYFARPGQTVGSTAKGTPSTATPAAVQPISTATLDRAETPVSASKSWFRPGVKLQKPFKLPGRSPAPATLSSGAVRHEFPLPPSKLQESKLLEQRQQEPRRENIMGGPDGGLGRDKGKGRAYSVDDDGEDVENSPPASRNDQPPIAKKPRVESAGSPAAAAPPRPARRSAADAAFEFAVSKKRDDSLVPDATRDVLTRAPPARTRSAPEQANKSDRTGRIQPLFRSSASPEKKTSTPMISLPKAEEDALEEEEEEELGDWMQDIELDAELFANDSAEEEKPLVGIGASTLADMGDGGMGGSKTTEDTGAGDGASAIRTEGKRTYNCLWRKATTAKKAGWAGDARLIVNGQFARLVDEANGKQLAAWTLPPDAELSFDKVHTFCGFHVEIQDAIVGVADPVMTTSSSTRARDPARATLPPQNTRAPAFKPPAPAKAVNPLARQFAARSASPAPAPHPPTRDAVQTALPPTSAVDFFRNPRMTGSLNGADGGSSRARKSGPLFDPAREGALVMLRPNEAHQAEYNKLNAPIVDVVVDPIISTKLREHQRTGVAFLYECVMGMRSSGQGCILADDMGLGKTIQSIALIWTLLKQSPYQTGTQGTIKRAMIVCPVTLINNWSQEFKKWLGKDRVRVIVGDSKQAIETFMYSKNYDVIVTGYEKVREHVELLRAAQPPIGLIICDEGHRLKSDKTKTSKALQSLSCMRRVILSGTPIQNNLGEFFAMLDFVNPGILQDADYFRKNFERPIMAARQPDASSKQRQEGAEAQETLAAIRSHFVLRRENSVIMQHLPAKYEYTVFIRPTDLQLAVYREALGNPAIKTMLEGFDVKTGISLLQTLLKLATSPGLLLKQIKEKGFGQLDETIIDAFPPGTDSADFALSGKFSVLGAMLAELWKSGVEKVVVVSNYTSTLDLIETHCKRQKYPYCRLDGKTPQQDRIPMVDGFNRGPRSRNFVFLLSSKGGGTGLNIMGASRLIQLDSDWNPSNDLQAMARIHREGQTRVCVIYRFLTSGTVDEVIYQRQLTKLALSGSIMAGEGTAASSKSKNTFTADELRNLFTLHEDVACQTHDLLGCRCHLGEPAVDENDAAESESSGDHDDADSSEDEFEGGFVQASQYRDKDSERALARKRRDLSILRTWTHYNTRDLDRVDQIEDILLLSVIYEALERAKSQTSLPKLQEADQNLCGGQIAFVFGQKAGAPAPDAVMGADE